MTKPTKNVFNGYKGYDIALAMANPTTEVSTFWCVNPKASYSGDAIFGLLVEPKEITIDISGVQANHAINFLLGNPLSKRVSSADYNKVHNLWLFDTKEDCFNYLQHELSSAIINHNKQISELSVAVTKAEARMLKMDSPNSKVKAGGTRAKLLTKKFILETQVESLMLIAKEYHG